MLRLPTLACLALAAVLAGADRPEPIAINPTETVVIYGDSITEQNLYAAYVETWLRTRFPGRKLSVWNFGWGGDTAAGAAARWQRDVAPVRPTLVLTCFGMNDGGYRAPDPGVRERHFAAQRALAAIIAGSGARQVLVTAPPVDPTRRGDGDAYNQTLAEFADGLVALGAELKLPVVNLFQPMREVQRSAQAANQAFTMIPDSIHPDPVGHLVMAYHILRQVAGAGPIGSVAISDGRLASASGAVVSNLVARDGGLEFDLALPCLPMHLPPEARGGLALVPFQSELNALTLGVAGIDGPRLLFIDGDEVAALPGEALAKGIDLAALDQAPWSRQAEQVWRLAQLRWQHHLDAWRTLNQADLAQIRAVAAFRQVEADFVRGVESDLRTLARPRSSYHLTIVPENRIAIPALALSPIYPMKRSEFANRFAPETGDAVDWKEMPLDDEGGIDLNPVLNHPAECAVYARLRLRAEAACKLRLSLGSDDGLVVIANGKRRLERDTYRALAPDQDQATIELQPGDNEILLRVNNGDGGFGLSVKARVMGTTKVEALR